MNRAELENYIRKTYGVTVEYPWKNDDEDGVFRHKENRKWFALVMRIHKSKLGIKEDGKIDVVNLKCAENILPSMWEVQGIFPAYHMNKSHWITVALDGSVSEENIKFLLALSYDLTDKKRKNQPKV